MLARQEIHDERHTSYLYENGCGLCDVVVESIHSLATGEGAVPPWMSEEQCVRSDLHFIYEVYGIAPR